MQVEARLNDGLNRRTSALERYSGKVYCEIDSDERNPVAFGGFV